MRDVAHDDAASIRRVMLRGADDVARRAIYMMRFLPCCYAQPQARVLPYVYATTQRRHGICRRAIIAARAAAPRRRLFYCQRAFAAMSRLRLFFYRRYNMSAKIQRPDRRYRQRAPPYASFCRAMRY